MRTGMSVSLTFAVAYVVAAGRVLMVAAHVKSEGGTVCRRDEVLLDTRCEIEDLLTLAVRDLQSPSAYTTVDGRLLSDGKHRLAIDQLPKGEENIIRGGCKLLGDLHVLLRGLCRDVQERGGEHVLFGGWAQSILLALDGQLDAGFRATLDAAPSIAGTTIANTSAQIFDRHIGILREMLQVTASRMRNTSLRQYEADMLLGGQGLSPGNGSLLVLVAHLSETAVARAKLCLDNVAVALTVNYQHLWWSQGVIGGKDLGLVIRDVLLDPPLASGPRVVYEDIYGGRARVLEELLKHLGSLPGSETGLHMVEIGVADGNTSEYLLSRAEELRIQAYSAIDPYEGIDGNKRHAFTRKRLQPWIGKKVARLLRNRSLDTVASVADGSLDLVFIDGGHELHEVVPDIQAWAPKLRTGGILAGHDFHYSHLQIVWAAAAGCIYLSQQHAVHISFDSVWWCERSL